MSKVKPMKKVYVVQVDGELEGHFTNVESAAKRFAEILMEEFNFYLSVKTVVSEIECNGKFEMLYGKFYKLTSHRLWD